MSILKLLQKKLKEQSLDGFIIPSNDEFMGEYVPDSAKRLEFITGFTGSAGTALIMQNQQIFFTDGRYTLQAKAELHNFEIYNNSEFCLGQWLYENAKGKKIGYDPKLHILQSTRMYKGINIVTVEQNPIDEIWQDRPLPPHSQVRLHPLKYAGVSSADKRTQIAKQIAARGSDLAVLTAPDSICWLLNIRGNDVPYTPFILAYAIIYKSGEVDYYIDKSRVKGKIDANIKSPEKLATDLAKLKGKKVLLDPASPAWFANQLQNSTIIECADLCTLPKACKNAKEIEGMHQAHIRDGKAVTNFLKWLEKNQDITEIEVAEKLESFRKKSPLYLEPSFATIAGSAANGAIVHYHATPKTNKKLERNSLLLIDSGGQYLDGTTDITRTVAIGKPTAEMKRNFTLVLKGHIALAKAVFPKGTRGSQLDALARQHLWQNGLDYDHGTGHGVGSYLSVHEGPQHISKRGGDAILEVGMILSNEPGYYKTGEYGIRIESLLVVKEVSKGFLGFETLTKAPIDKKLIDIKLLNKEEKIWLKEYHQTFNE